MNKQIVQQLVDIYNNLLQVHTCGTDSFVMTDNMRALYNIITGELKENNNNNIAEG